MRGGERVSYLASGCRARAASCHRRQMKDAVPEWSDIAQRGYALAAQRDSSDTHGCEQQRQRRIHTAMRSMETRYHSDCSTAGGFVSRRVGGQGSNAAYRELSLLQPARPSKAVKATRSRCTARNHDVDCLPRNDSARPVTSCQPAWNGATSSANIATSSERLPFQYDSSSSYARASIPVWILRTAIGGSHRSLLDRR